MLGFHAETKNEPKCNVTYGVMGHLDPQQPPTKRKPFASILNHDFIQRVEFILPQELFEIFQTEVLVEQPIPDYSQVILPLKALLESDFFNEYIKKGNILMLSEGKIGVDNVYSMKEGVLTLHLDKESYERAGLVGKPDGVKGKRGTKPRWVVEINLRLPSMLHGKKGFDRILYAFKNILTTPVTWLFKDLGKEALIPDPLGIHFPTRKTATPAISQDIEVDMPSLKPPTEVNTEYSADFEDFAAETYEWLSLIMLNSPRIDPDDEIDPILSRYAPPGEALKSCKVVKIVWHGFLSPSWAHKMFVQTLIALPRDAWFSSCISGFKLVECKDCTILKLPDAPKEYMLWDIA